MYTFSLFHSIIFFSINLNSPSCSVDYYLPTRLKGSFPAKAYLYVKEKGVFALDRKIHLTLDHNARFFTCSGMGGGGWDVSSEEEVCGCNIWGMCNLLYSCTLQQLSVSKHRSWWAFHELSAVPWPGTVLAWPAAADAWKEHFASLEIILDLHAKSPVCDM